MGLGLGDECEGRLRREGTAAAAPRRDEATLRVEGRGAAAPRGTGGVDGGNYFASNGSYAYRVRVRSLESGVIETVTGSVELVR